MITHRVAPAPRRQTRCKQRRHHARRCRAQHKQDDPVASVIANHGPAAVADDRATMAKAAAGSEADERRREQPAHERHGRAATAEGEPDRASRRPNVTSGNTIQPTTRSRRTEHEHACGDVVRVAAEADAADCDRAETPTTTAEHGS